MDLWPQGKFLGLVMFKLTPERVWTSGRHSWFSCSVAKQTNKQTRKTEKKNNWNKFIRQKISSSPLLSVNPLLSKCNALTFQMQCSGKSWQCSLPIKPVGDYRVCLRDMQAFNLAHRCFSPFPEVRYLMPFPYPRSIACQVLQTLCDLNSLNLSLKAPLGYAQSPWLSKIPCTQPSLLLLNRIQHMGSNE